MKYKVNNFLYGIKVSLIIDISKIWTCGHLIKFDYHLLILMIIFIWDHYASISKTLPLRYFL